MCGSTRGCKKEIWRTNSTHVLSLGGRVTIICVWESKKCWVTWRDSVGVRVGAAAAAAAVILSTHCIMTPLTCNSCIYIWTHKYIYIYPHRHTCISMSMTTHKYQYENTHIHMVSRTYGLYESPFCLYESPFWNFECWSALMLYFFLIMQCNNTKLVAQDNQLIVRFSLTHSNMQHCVPDSPWWVQSPDLTCSVAHFQKVKYQCLFFFGKRLRWYPVFQVVN